MDEKIYKIKKANIGDMKDDCAMDKWLIGMLQKKVSELSLLDISRMIRQEIYVDIAISIAWKMLKENPFEGEMYDGQLLELLVRYLNSHYEANKKSDYIDFKKALNSKMINYEWENEEDKNNYVINLDKLDLIFQNKQSN